MPDMTLLLMPKQHWFLHLSRCNKAVVWLSKRCTSLIEYIYDVPFILSCCIEKSHSDILLNISFCFSQKTENNTGWTIPEMATSLFKHSLLTQPADLLLNYYVSWFWSDHWSSFICCECYRACFSHTTLLPHYPHSPYRSSVGLPIYLTASPWLCLKGMNDGCVGSQWGSDPRRVFFSWECFALIGCFSVCLN